MSHSAPPLQILFIPGRLPGLNDLIRTAKVRRGAWSLYQQTTANWHRTIALLARAQGLAPVGRAFLSFTWLEANRRRDPSNVAAAGQKYIEDALQKAGILANDGWRHIAGYAHHFGVKPDQPGVIVEIHDITGGVTHE